MSANETVKVEMRVPKPLVEFVHALCKFTKTDFDKFWENEARVAVEAIIGSTSGPYICNLVERYGLKQILEDC